VPTQSWRGKPAVIRIYCALTSNGYSKSIYAVRRQRNLGLQKWLIKSKTNESNSDSDPFESLLPDPNLESTPENTGTCFIQKIYAPSSSLLQGKHLPFSPSPLRLNIFRLFVILLLTQWYRYTPDIFLFTTATFKYTYRAPLRRIGQEYQRT
jgi:hypothetical protein